MEGMSPSIESVKHLILRCYRKLNPRELDGLKPAYGGYLTADRKWLYFLRHGGFIEREPTTGRE